MLGDAVASTIETIGDVDWWEVASLDQEGVLAEFMGTFESELDLQLYVFDSAGQ